MYISIHALVKRATESIPRPPRIPTISIHALVKRATGEGHIDAAYGGISIHALVKRATYEEDGYTDYIRNFNPRPREEGDIGG